MLHSRSKIITYSSSWTFVPTHYCRNTCGYCAFVERTGERAQLVSINEARKEIERARSAGATELLVMSGEGVEESRPVRDRLRREGFTNYIDYLVAVARIALEHDILPHINIGNVNEDELRELRQVVPSMGMMLETVDDKLRRTPAHLRAPDKEPARRLATLRAAGAARVPWTTGLLVGIGETETSRAETIKTIVQIHQQFGHIQEVIIQPFTPHAKTLMENAAPPRFEELRDCVAMARALLPDEVTVQIPPNIAPRFLELIEAGATDLGGVSSDGDRINPEERWLAPRSYAASLMKRGYALQSRLAIYDDWIANDWMSSETLEAVARVRRRLPQIIAASPSSEKEVYV
ncbi:MAG: 7,8-didemethyl-8-hydroxy-5-deazariboflavin synthase subunit CofG [Pyrinomonadaceae bacterium]|nr:7,8-didemethyl-8-hydroxy-5-deazariboflavin synthase subunit CofG [Pyrinomonadaceae bacterium]